MTRAPIYQMLIAVLLLSSAGVWWVTRRSVPKVFLPVPVAGLVSPPVIEESSPIATEGPDQGNDSVLEKDPFAVPSLLAERFRQLELKRQREEMATAPVLVEQGRLPVEPLLPSLRLQAVLWGTDRPQAIIDRQVVSVGDVVQGMKILRISQEGVSVSFGKKEVVYKLPEDQRADTMQKEWMSR